MLMATLREARVSHPVGQVSTILLAVGVTLIASAHGWTWTLSDWDGWPLLSRIVPIAAWVNVPAWFASRWGIVILCSMLTFLAPWGFIYPGILAGPILAIAAGLHWAKAGRAKFGHGPSRVLDR